MDPRMLCWMKEKSISEVTWCMFTLIGYYDCIYIVWFYLYNILKRIKYRDKKDTSSYWDYKELQGQGGYGKKVCLERCVMILVVVQEPIYVIKLQRALYQNQRAHIKTDV